MRPTKKQITYLSHLIFESEAEDAKRFMSELPNDFYFAAHRLKKIDLRGDYRRFCFEERLLEKTDITEMSHLISLVQSYNFKRLEEVLKNRGIKIKEE